MTSRIIRPLKKQNTQLKMQRNNQTTFLKSKFPISPDDIGTVPWFQLWTVAEQITNPNTTRIVSSSPFLPLSFILTRSSYTLKHVLFQLQHPASCRCPVLKWMQYFHLKVCLGTASPALHHWDVCSSQRRTIFATSHKNPDKGPFYVVRVMQPQDRKYVLSA